MFAAMGTWRSAGWGPFDVYLISDPELIREIPVTRWKRS
jgi:hypothetical protein